MKYHPKDRLPWAQLLKRVFDEDVLTCNKCGGLRRAEAFVSSPIAGLLCRSCVAHPPSSFMNCGRP